MKIDVSRVRLGRDEYRVLRPAVLGKGRPQSAGLAPLPASADPP
ncbi:hypothetical protein AB0G06_05195 [Nonomuraea dietziae]